MKFLIFVRLRADTTTPLRLFHYKKKESYNATFMCVKLRFMKRPPFSISRICPSGGARDDEKKKAKNGNRRSAPAVTPQRTPKRKFYPVFIFEPRQGRKLSAAYVCKTTRSVASTQAKVGLG